MNSKTNKSKTNKSHRPVIIIGAGRSGTNMLRDLLVQLPGLTTWPCDEINYIWRYGNRSFPTDEFTRNMADPAAVAYIRRQFAKLSSDEIIVEKTCANSLRCGFVREVFPEARFIHIVRDGRDVAASASLRWNAELDIPYILKKARYVPFRDVPYYGFKYVNSRIYRMFSGKTRLSTWGPRFQGIHDIFQEYELPVGCAVQWKKCVESSRTQLEDLPSDQLLTIRYESFTKNPIEEFRSVCDFIDATYTDSDLKQLTAGVSNRSVGKWESQLTESQVSTITNLTGELLSNLGYC
ncbi:MAG: sulfotransferase [Fuerstiella sp.]